MIVLMLNLLECKFIDFNNNNNNNNNNDDDNNNTCT